MGSNRCLPFPCPQQTIAVASHWRRSCGIGAKRGAALGMSLVLWLAGCGPRGATALSLDKALARASLTRFLDAWRDGQKSDQLASAQPPVIGRDPAWSDGQDLLAYELLGETDDGANLHARVKLKLGRKNSDVGPANLATQEVTYLVGTSPVITIFRDE